MSIYINFPDVLKQNSVCLYWYPKITTSGSIHQLYRSSLAFLLGMNKLPIFLLGPLSVATSTHNLPWLRPPVTLGAGPDLYVCHHEFDTAIPRALPSNELSRENVASAL